MASEARASDPQRPTVVLAELLRVLAEAVDVRVDPEAAQEAARAAEALPLDAPERLARAAAAVGLRVGWVVCSPAEALSAARPDLPLVTPETSGWLVVDHFRRRARVRRFPGLISARWTRSKAERQLGSGPRSWGQVEPALPADALARREPGEPKPSPLRRLRGLLRGERQDLLAIVIYAVGVGILSLATPLVIQVLINWLAFRVVLQPLMVLALVLLVCLALAAVLRGLERVAVEMVQRRLFVRIVSDVATRTIRARPQGLDGRYGPELVNRIFDVLTVQKALSSLMLDGLAAALQAVVGMVLLAIYHPALFGFDLLLVGGLLAVLLLLGRGGQPSAIAESKAKYQVAGWLEELARHPTLFRLGGSDRLAVERTDGLLQTWLDDRRRHFRVFFRQYAGSLVLQVLASAALLVLAGSLVLDEQLTLGQLVAAEFVVAAMLAGFVKFTGKLDAWYDLLAGVDKLGELADLPQDEARGLSPAEEGAVRLELQGVGLRRADGELELVPDRVVAAGTRLALVCDEATPVRHLAEALLGIRHPAEGRVLRAGLELRAWHPDALHRDAGLAAGPELIHASILDNVLLRRPGLDEVQAWEALERVGLKARIRALPDGLHTRVGPSGAPLSPPEVVRLLLARAVAGRPRLVVVVSVLDSLPSQAREEVLAPLLEPAAPWTLVVLTHDPQLAQRFPERGTIGAERD